MNVTKILRETDSNTYHRKYPNMFSVKVKALRIKKKLNLRELCFQAGLDTSEWSKVERGIDPPPGDKVVLKKLAGILGLRADDRQSLIRQALKDNKNFKPKPMPEFRDIMPPFVRTVDNRKLTKDDIKKLFEMLREAHTPTQKSQKIPRRKPV